VSFFHCTMNFPHLLSVESYCFFVTFWGLVFTVRWHFFTLWWTVNIFSLYGELLLIFHFMVNCYYFFTLRWTVISFPLYGDFSLSSDVLFSLYGELFFSHYVSFKYWSFFERITRWAPVSFYHTEALTLTRFDSYYVGLDTELINTFVNWK